MDNGPCQNTNENTIIIMIILLQQMQNDISIGLGKG